MIEDAVVLGHMDASLLPSLFLEHNRSGIQKLSKYVVEHS